ncbi:hypothetical protein ACFWP5_34895 [Streptomyces sp. NPDC058469]|uniref:hypothetical protein n=1 Tax=Streptomyces sp. NPDC058469 TaxID=3346514 RepID=UPI003666F766
MSESKHTNTEISNLASPNATLDQPSPLPTTAVLLYGSSGTGDFYQSLRGEQAGQLRLIGNNPGWRTTWEQIVPGNYGGATQCTDLLFYDPDAREGIFYAVGDNGALVALGKPNEWRSTWYEIIPGRFGGSTGLTDLLFYDRTVGEAEFYASEGDGRMKPIGGLKGWRTTWTHIVPGNFKQGTELTDLFFYDSNSGDALFLASNGKGGTIPIGTGIPRWSHDFGTFVVPGNFGSGSGYTDLFCYNAGAGVGEFVATDGEGHLSSFGFRNDLPTTWSRIAPGNFGGPHGLTDLLVYDATQQQIKFFSTNGQGGLSDLGSPTSQKPFLARIIPGVFIANL